MINLVVSCDRAKSFFRTLHIDEVTGVISTQTSHINDVDDLRWLDKTTQEENSLFSTYEVIKGDGTKQFQYAEPATCGLDDINDDDDFTQYDDEPSLLGLMRALVVGRGVMLKETQYGDRFYNLSALEGNNSSLGMTLKGAAPISLTESSWFSSKVFYNDFNNNFVVDEQCRLLIPKTNLGTYEKHIKRIKEKVVTCPEGEEIKYDEIEIDTASMPVVTEKPICFTSVQALGAFQFLLDSYKLFLPVIRELLFEKENILSRQSSSSEKTAYGGFVNLKGSYNISGPLRNKYIDEILLIGQQGVETSLLLDNQDNMFHSFIKLWNIIQPKVEKKSDLLKTYKGFMTSKALLEILLLEAKCQLFFNDKRYLSLLTNFSQIDVGILNYNIYMKVGGAQWRPQI